MQVGVVESKGFKRVNSRTSRVEELRKRVNSSI